MGEVGSLRFLIKPNFPACKTNKLHIEDLFFHPNTKCKNLSKGILLLTESGHVTRHMFYIQNETLEGQPIQADRLA